MILYQMDYGVDAAVNCSIMVIFIAKVLPQWTLLILCNVQCMPHKLVYTLILSRRNWNNRNAKQRLHCIYINRALISNDLIHHIKCHNHWQIHFQKLHCQIKVSLNIRCIYYIDNGSGLLIQNKIPGNNLFAAVRRHGIDARQVSNKRIGKALDGAILSVHCNTGKIADMLICTGQLIKQRSFATVLISYQRISQFLPLRQWIFILFGMIFPFLTQPRMHRIYDSLTALMAIAALINGLNLNLRRFCKPERQLVAMHLQLHRVTHRRKLHNRNLCSGNHSHIQKMLPQRAASAYFLNDSVFSNFQFL